MKQKMASLAIVLGIVLMIAGCGGLADQGVKNQKTNEVQAQEKEKSVLKDNEAKGYQIIRKVSENKDNNTKIFYPQISGHPGQLLMEYMNQSLKKVVDIYGKKEMYKDISIDYKITKMDKNIISVLFKGTGSISGGSEITIQQSINLDIKSSNEITYKNLIKNSPTSLDAVRAILNQKAKAIGLKYGVEAEGIKIYFERENVVFYFMPADDSATSFVEISVPIKELESFLNDDFGKRPAS